MILKSIRVECFCPNCAGIDLSASFIVNIKKVQLHAVIPSRFCYWKGLGKLRWHYSSAQPPITYKNFNMQIVAVFLCTKKSSENALRFCICFDSNFIPISIPIEVQLLRRANHKRETFSKHKVRVKSSHIHPTNTLTRFIEHILLSLIMIYWFSNLILCTTSVQVNLVNSYCVYYYCVY